MAVKFTNNAATTLAAGINSSVTSIAVTDGSVFPTITGSDHFYVTFDDTTNKEIVKVTARSGNTLTVVRGHDNTTARAFSSGDKAELRIVAALLDDVKTDVSSTLTVDTFTGDGSTTAFTLSAAPASEDNLIVFIEGVYQNPGDFTLSGTTLTLDVAPANSRKIIVYHVSHLVSGNNLTHNQFTCNGSTTAFTLSLSPIHENNTQVFLDGVYQQKTDYAVSGTTLTMDTAPANGAILEVMTFTQTEVNTLPASFVSGLTEVTAVGADHFMIFDATDSALKKSLVSDVLESATSISTSADATAITIDSNEKVTFTSDVTTGGHLSVGGSNNELRFYEGSNYVGFEAPALSADKIWVLPAADGSSGQVISTDGSGNLSFATVTSTTINNNADNRIITGSGTANTLEGEANLTFDNTNLVVGTTGSITLPAGTTAQRPGSPANGMIRYNTSKTEMESYVGGGWKKVTTEAYPIIADFLVIAGGGGGSGSGAGSGGGGAGGYRSSWNSEASGGGGSSESSITLTAGAQYTVTVGAGGAGGAGTSSYASSGSASSIAGSGITTISTVGGGEGNYTNQGGNGGSGGGSGGGNTNNSSGTANQGYGGGSSKYHGNSYYGGGGGGGASAVGQDAYGGSPLAGGWSSGDSGAGDGGNGVASTITGSSVTRAGGGGGGTRMPNNSTLLTTGSGGTGGGGDAGTNPTTGKVGQDATANTGSGGGAGSSQSSGSGGGDGASGVVILRLPTDQYTGTTTGSPTVTTSGDDTIITFNSSGSYTA